MYDTIHFWLGSERESHYDPSLYAQNLLNITEHIKEGSVYYTGSLENGYRVTISQYGISLKGSLSTFYFSSNCHDLDPGRTGESIEKISDLLNVNVSAAKITRLDIAKNYFTKYPPSLYYPYLSEARYYQRLVQPDSLYYKNGLRTMLFYDKKKECKKNRKPIPKEWQDKNVLRYELRFTARLQRQFMVNEVTASMLSECSFYDAVKTLYLKEYDSILKLPTPFNIEFEKIKKPKDLTDQILAQAIVDKGLNKTMHLIELAKANGCFKNNEAYSRLKYNVKSLALSIGAKNDLIQELDLLFK